MTTEEKVSKRTNILLWSAQWLLAVTLVWAGFMKLINPADLPWPWIKENPNLVILTGILDLLAGIGLVLPALLYKKNRLTAYIAYGIIALMMGAIVFHICRDESSQIGFNVLLIIIAGFIAWGRRLPVTLKQ